MCLTFQISHAQALSPQPPGNLTLVQGVYKVGEF